jgi:hypothetical protein
MLLEHQVLYFTSRKVIPLELAVCCRVLSYMIFVSETKNNTVGFGQGTGSVWLCFVFSAGRCLLSSVSVACQPGALVNFYAVEAFES